MKHLQIKWRFKLSLCWFRDKILRSVIWADCWNNSTFESIMVSDPLFIWIQSVTNIKFYIHDPKTQRIFIKITVACIHKTAGGLWLAMSTEQLFLEIWNTWPSLRHLLYHGNVTTRVSPVGEIYNCTYCTYNYNCL